MIVSTTFKGGANPESDVWGGGGVNIEGERSAEVWGIPPNLFVNLDVKWCNSGDFEELIIEYWKLMFTSPLVIVRVKRSLDAFGVRSHWFFREVECIHRLNIHRKYQNVICK